MKWIVMFACLLFCGCRTVVNYEVKTKVDNIWHSKPDQSLEFSANWRR